MTHEGFGALEGSRFSRKIGSPRTRHKGCHPARFRSSHELGISSIFSTLKFCSNLFSFFELFPRSIPERRPRRQQRKKVRKRKPRNRRAARREARRPRLRSPKNPKNLKNPKNPKRLKHKLQPLLPPIECFHFRVDHSQTNQ